jgi:hypothetical protein
VTVPAKLDIFSPIRDRGAPGILGAVFIGILVVALALFLLFGNGTTSRILFFPHQTGRRLVTEQRSLPRRGGFEKDVVELVEGVLLGPTRHDAQRLFPRGGRVIAAMMNGRTLYLDLSASILVTDPDVPLAGEDALDALAHSIRFNFPRVREVVFLLDGQSPRFAKGARQGVAADATPSSDKKI